MFDVGLKMENEEQFKKVLAMWPDELRESLFRSMQRTANFTEKELKTTHGFEDRTGHLRRTIYADAIYNPLGINIGVKAKYAIYTEQGHGTWKGGWFTRDMQRIMPLVQEKIMNGLKRAVEKFSKMAGMLTGGSY